MSKSGVLGKFKPDKHYIITKPRAVQDLDEDDLFFDRLDYKLREKAHRLQARRWRRLKHQMV